MLRSSARAAVASAADSRPPSRTVSRSVVRNRFMVLSVRVMADAVPTKSRSLSSAPLERFEERHKAGDPLAVHECVVYCHKQSLALPQWALATLAARAERYLGGEDLLPAFGFAGQGRHADPRVKRQEQLRREESVAAMRAAQCAGLRGQPWILQGAAVYDQRNPDDYLDTETMQRHFQWWQRGKAWSAPINDPHELLVTVSGQLHQLQKCPTYTLVSGMLGSR